MQVDDVSSPEEAFYTPIEILGDRDPLQAATSAANSARRPLPPQIEEDEAGGSDDSDDDAPPEAVSTSAAAAETFRSAKRAAKAADL